MAGGFDEVGGAAAWGSRGVVMDVHVRFLEIVCYSGVENRGWRRGRIVGSGLNLGELGLFLARVTQTPAGLTTGDETGPERAFGQRFSRILADKSWGGASEAG